MKKKRINWFDFKDCKLSGWGFLGRMICGSLLLFMIIPGFWLIASTAYKRARSFNWSHSLAVVSAIAMCFYIISTFFLEAGAEEGIFLIYFPTWIFYLVLLFKNGNKNQNDSEPIDIGSFGTNNSNTVIIEDDLVNKSKDSKTKSSQISEENEIEDQTGLGRDIDSRWRKK